MTEEERFRFLAMVFEVLWRTERINVVGRTNKVKADTNDITRRRPSFEKHTNPRDSQTGSPPIVCRTVMFKFVNIRGLGIRSKIYHTEDRDCRQRRAQ